MTEVKKIAPSLIEMAKEVVALKAIAGPGDLDTAQIKPNSEGEWVECPACNGDGMVDAETYVNFDDKPLTVQFYGIGESFSNYQNLFDAGIKHAPALAAALLRAEELLEVHANQFEFYEKQHRAKGTPDADAKAEVNSALVETARAFLASLKEPRSHRRKASERY